MLVKKLIEILSTLDAEKRILINSEGWVNDIGYIEPIKNDEIYVIYETLKEVTKC